MKFLSWCALDLVINYVMGDASIIITLDFDRLHLPRLLSAWCRWTIVEFLDHSREELNQSEAEIRSPMGEGESVFLHDLHRRMSPNSEKIQIRLTELTETIHINFSAFNRGTILNVFPRTKWHQTYRGLSICVQCRKCQRRMWTGLISVNCFQRRHDCCSRQRLLWDIQFRRTDQPLWRRIIFVEDSEMHSVS